MNNLVQVALVLDDTAIEGYDLRVNCELVMPSTDLSGNTSSTAISEEGFKPKKISVSLKIRYDDQEKLAQLVNLAEALDDNSTRRVYTIVSQTARAYNVRQVRFSERLQATELQDELAWQVRFNLLEHLSVPEKVESQQASAETTQGAAQTAATAADEEIAPDTGLIERSIAWVDSLLAEDAVQADNEVTA